MKASMNMHTQMNASSTLIHVGDQDFAAKVRASQTPMIVDFWAAWCASCRAIAPVYEKLSMEYAGGLLFAKMDVDEHPETPGRLGIQGFPTLVLFKAGKEIGRLIGPHPAHLKTAIDRVLAENGVA